MQGPFRPAPPNDIRAGRLVIELFEMEVRCATAHICSADCPSSKPFRATHHAGAQNIRELQVPLYRGARHREGLQEVSAPKGHSTCRVYTSKMLLRLAMTVVTCVRMLGACPSTLHSHDRGLAIAGVQISSHCQRCAVDDTMTISLR